MSPARRLRPGIATRASSDCSLAAGYLLQTGEKFADRLPDLRATRQSMPFRPQQTDQLVTLVDRHAIMLPSRADAINQQRLDVRLKLAQQLVFRLQFVPGFQRQQ